MSNDSTLRFRRLLRGVRSGRHSSTGEGAQDLQLADRSKQLAREASELERRRRALSGREVELQNKQEELQQRLDQLAGLIQSVQSEKAEMLKANEEEIVSLSLKITEKVLQHEVEHGRYKMGEVVRGALEAVRQKGSLVVRVNPRDLELTREAVRKLTETRGGAAVEILPDESIPLASCCVETESGKIFSQVPARLEKIEKSLLKRNGDPDGV